jgi:type II secretory pathway component GspD/PulD (secretin)
MRCKVVFVEHADCEAVAKHVRCLFPGHEDEEQRKATWFAPANAVMLRALPEELDQMEYLISQIDVPRPEPEPKPQAEEVRTPTRQWAIIPVHHAAPKELGKVVETIIRMYQGHRGTVRTGPPAYPVHVVTDARTKVLVVLGTDEQIGLVKELVEALDVPIDR